MWHIIYAATDDVKSCAVYDVTTTTNEINIPGKLLRIILQTITLSLPIPTSVLKLIADVIAPFIVEMFNRSLSEGHFPAVFKEAFITPVMKKPGLDAADTSSYRPISNMPVLSKLLERLVVRQLMGYLLSAVTVVTIWIPPGTLD